MSGMTDLDIKVSKMVKERNKKKVLPYIAYHYVDNLLITCFTDSPRVRKVVSCIDDVNAFFDKVKEIR